MQATSASAFVAPFDNPEGTPLVHQLSDTELRDVLAEFKSMEETALRYNGKYAGVLAEPRLFGYRQGATKVTVSYDTATSLVVERHEYIISSLLKAHFSPRGRIVMYTWDDETLLTNTETHAFERAIPEAWYEPLMQWLTAQHKSARLRNM